MAIDLPERALVVFHRRFRGQKEKYVKTSPEEQKRRQEDEWKVYYFFYTFRFYPVLRLSPCPIDLSILLALILTLLDRCTIIDDSPDDEVGQQEVRGCFSSHMTPLHCPSLYSDWSEAQSNMARF